MYKPIVIIILCVSIFSSMSCKHNKVHLKSDNTGCIIEFEGKQSILVGLTDAGRIYGLSLEDSSERTSMVINFNEDGVVSFKINDNNSYEIITNILKDSDIFLQRYEKTGNISNCYEILTDGSIRLIK